MGLRGPVGSGQSRVERATLTVIDATPTVPAPPIKLRAPVLRKWESLWRSQVAKFIDPDADAGALERWCEHWNEWHRLSAVLKRRPFLTGSQGQAVINPLYTVLEQVTKHLERFEDDFAARPKARVRLNLEGVQGALTAEQLNRMLRDDRGSSDDGTWAEGFRAAD